MWKYLIHKFPINDMPTMLVWSVVISALTCIGLIGLISIFNQIPQFPC